MIEIRNLTKRFGAATAVDDLSFQVNPGEVLGFLGPNGAGKSTTMKMVTGFLSPTSGKVLVDGKNVASKPIAAKSLIGYLPEGAPLYPDMTPRSLLEFVAEARGIAASERADRIADAVRRVQLEDVLEQRIETLSKGFKRRVGLALAIVHDPPVLILDEPTDGLDPNQKEQVRDLIREMSGEKVIVLSTHILEEVEAVCTRAIIIADGRLLFDGKPTELRQRSRYYGAVEVALEDAPTDAARQLESVGGVARVETLGTEGNVARFLALPQEGAKPFADVHRLVEEAGWNLRDIHVDRGRMDDVFREVTGASRPSGAPTAPAETDTVTETQGVTP